jgi:hypothetical protein
MFAGHLAVALGAKTVEPRVPLAALVAAAFGLDVLWPVLVLAGLETVRIQPGITAFTPLDFASYPWSHSLLMSVAWGAAAIAVYVRAAPARGATGRWAFWALAAFVGAIWATGPVAPPPPSPAAIGVVSLVFAALTVPWAIWIERHRSWRT